MGKLKKSHISDPFAYIASSIKTGDRDDDLWEEKPVSIQEFIESPKFLNLKWDPETKRGCRPKIMEIAIALTDPNVREAILLLGKGSGKDFISSIIHLYGIYLCLCMYSPQEYYGLSHNSPIYFVNTARNVDQAKNVFFREFKGHLEGCRWFDGKYEDPGAMEIRFTKGVVALSSSSSAFGWLGYNTIQWVGDELAFFLEKDNAGEDDGEDNKSRAMECWEAAYGSCQTRFPKHYKMIGITTPRYDDDFVMTKFKELDRRMKSDGSAYVRQAATWEMNPRTPYEAFKHAMERDERRTMRDFGAIPVGVIESFYPHPKYVEENVCEQCMKCPIYQNRELRANNEASNRECYEYDDCKANAYMGNGRYREWFEPDPEVIEYIGHIDLSTNRDRIGFTLGHTVDIIKVQIDPFSQEYQMMMQSGEDMSDAFVDKPIIKIDALISISNRDLMDKDLVNDKGYFDYDAIIRNCIAFLVNKGFNISKITTDQFQSHFFRQTVEKYGIVTEVISLDRTDEIPVRGRDATLENRVIYPYHRVLCNETKYLKYVKGKKVDHTNKSSKDLWDSFAGTIWNIEESGAGMFMFSIIQEEED